MTEAQTHAAPAPVTPRRPRSRFVAIFLYTLRSCVPPKRWLAVLWPCAGALLFGLLAHAVHHFPTRERAFANVAAEGIFSLMMPIAALVIGDSVLGAEVRAGTLHFTWLSPTPTWQIILGRWLGGSAVTQLASSNGDAGMRYTDGQYLFNLSTKRSQFAGGLDLTTGTWYVLARADADEVVTETQETNNVASDSIVIGPDLDVFAFSAPATGGAGLPITVTDTTKNLGGGLAPGSTVKF